MGGARALGVKVGDGGRDVPQDVQHLGLREVTPGARSGGGGLTDTCGICGRG